MDSILWLYKKGNRLREGPRLPRITQIETHLELEPRSPGCSAGNRIP